ncbi:AAA family ATPase [Coleofasciculus sp. F4-SAH-05]|uniref:AAA family ATPase n=1 Tax=Coleofasciculus sp. F4-SAH-05 TaxID=3069525 RepID=UPI0032F620BD
MDILDYQVRETVYESANSLIYRAYCKLENHGVMLKMLKQAYQSPTRIAKLQREYEITKSLNISGIVNVYDLSIDQNRWVMVVEDFGGESLAKLNLNGQLALEQFLTLAINIVEILGQVHENNIIHKDINPSNIVWNRSTGEIKLIDFGISIQLARENTTFRNPDGLEGTLAYISPEQTGRMNRAIDYRTDFYSLGITFYELLTGQLPFWSQDVLELLHCHIAKQPVPPHELRPELSTPISDIVLKLMAKNAEDRYQSAHGLKADLQECLQQWQASNQIAHFLLSQQDISNQFRTCQKLYGRQREIDTLLASFERVSQGTSELMLVSGYSGIGKSALVREVYKPITQRRGYFITGKFDQFQRNIPYASLVSAFRSLICQLLTESQAQIDIWREKLIAALAPNGQVIVDVIPEVELIIGPQPSVPALGPAEAQNRFNLFFQRFIQVFTQPEHPLVIFLDDLQWADSASLKLIELLMTTKGSHHLLLIGAYRDNEVSGTHPLIVTLEEIKKGAAKVEQILLTPLDLTNISQLTADTLNGSPEQAKPLAQLLLTKTHGNPFFINEFLTSLYTEKLLTFDPYQNSWHWNIEQIQERDITDNVVELMANRLSRLGEDTQRTLKLAACIGNQFELRSLATICEKSPHATAASLWAAMNEGLILPLGDAYKLLNLDLEVEGLANEVTVEYKFAHDRIQQAAYGLIADIERQAVHHHIGQLLLANTPSQEREQKIFDIVNQLNQGQGCLTHQTERDKLAELNLQAGQKARASAAYQVAFNYLKIGIKLLNPAGATDCWQREYDLSLNLYLEAADLAGLTSHEQELDDWTEIIFQNAHAKASQLKAYEIKLSAYTTQQKLPETAEIALQILQLSGISLPDEITLAVLFRRLEDVKSLWADSKIEDLVELPEIKDEAQLATLSLLQRVAMVASIGTFPGEMDFQYLILEVFDKLLQSGSAAFSSIIYIQYGGILCARVHEIDAGYRFGELGLKSFERFQDKQYEAFTLYMFNTFIRHWKNHLRQSLNSFIDTYHSGLETGDLFWGLTSFGIYALHAFWVGENLAEIEQKIVEYHQIISNLKYELAARWVELVRQLSLSLLGKTDDPCYLASQSYDETSMLAHYYALNDRPALHYFFFNKAHIYYLFRNYRKAIECIAEVEKHSRHLMIGMYTVVVHNFYDSLAQLAIFPEARKLEQEHIIEKVAKNQAVMKNWADHAPMNYLHKFYLVEAERVRIFGNDREARELYDQAISLAQENEYVNEEALAYELAGRFYLSRNQKHLARYYLQDAHYAYQRWGAVAKVRDLEQQYPQFLAKAKTDSMPTYMRVSTTTSSDETASEVLDLNSILKASQAIASEIVLDNLLENLMRIAIENAGAQKGFLLLSVSGETETLVIEAEGTVDSETVKVLQSQAIDTLNSETHLPLLSTAIVNYVTRVRQSVVLNDAVSEGKFTQDPYIKAVQPKSVLCSPLLNQGKLSGILYLENNLTTGAFTEDRVELLQTLSAQAAISIENARLYQQLEDYNRTLEQKVTERTEQLQHKNEELSQTLQELKTTQNELIQSEKMAALGQLVAGIAHEINTPLGAIRAAIGNTDKALEASLSQLPQLLPHLNPQQQADFFRFIEQALGSQPRLSTREKRQIKRTVTQQLQGHDIANAKQLAHLLTEGGLHDSFASQLSLLQTPQVNQIVQIAYDIARLNANSQTINNAVERASKIVFALKSYARSDHREEKQSFQIVNNIETVLELYHNYLKKGVEVRRHYQSVPEIPGYPDELVQVWTNLIHNGIQAMEGKGILEIGVRQQGQNILVEVTDSGCGIPPDIQDKIFQPFFTTKGAGEGSGLGLDIVQKILEKHQGSITFASVLGKTTFTVALPIQ